MGKNEKNKKKGKGAEKTAEKTEKRLKLRIKKTTGEDDVDSVVKAIEEEERKRLEVKEELVGPPSHRSNLSVCVHPDHPELVFFGGEFYNGQTTRLFNELLFYNLKRKEWKEIKSPAGPAPRCSHQAVVSSQSGGQMWLFGGEYASPSESQFHHYKDLWVLHFNSNRWEKVVAKDGPSSRSGHRMVMVKRHLIVFGGFNHSLKGGNARYFDDVHAFDVDNRKWKKLEITGAKAPSPRSGSCMAALSDGRVVILGGYCVERDSKASASAAGSKKSAGVDSKGKTLNDMFLLVPDKHDETLTKWRWHSVKQTGCRPAYPRSGMACAAMPNSNRIFLFGGVQDDVDDDSDGDGDEEDEIHGNFFNELYTVQIENNDKASWNLVTLGQKEKSVQPEREDTEDVKEMETLKLKEQDIDDPVAPETVVVQEGVFTISSTIGADRHPERVENEADAKNPDSGRKSQIVEDGPSPRFGSSMEIRQGVLYLFGGLFEDDAGDRQLTYNDFYALDTKKLDGWETLIKSDVSLMDWHEEDEDDDDEEEDSGSEEEEEDMDTE